MYFFDTYIYVLGLLKPYLFYNFYFFWVSYWSELILCQLFLFYFTLLLLFSTNIYKNLMYVTFILIYVGFYISILQYEIFMCFLWVFESTILLLILILSLIFKNNVNNQYYYVTQKYNFLVILLVLFFYVYMFNKDKYFLIDLNILNFIFYTDIYVHLKNCYQNDLFLLFLSYYYYYITLLYLILLIILILTYFIILFFKLMKYNKLSDYLYFWNFSNKFFKKQSFEYQVSKKILLKKFFKKK